MTYFRMWIASMLVLASSPASAIFWQCQTKSGQSFPVIGQQQRLAGENNYDATMRALGLTHAQAIAQGVNCHEVMGENDPRPYSQELARKKWREEHADCVGPDEIANIRNGALLYKMAHGCTEDLGLADLKFMLGVMNEGIGMCKYSESLNKNLSFIGTNAAIHANLKPQTDMLEGTAYGKALGCGVKLKKLTEGGAVWFEANPEAPSETFRKAVRDNDR